MDVDGGRRVFHRLGPSVSGNDDRNSNNKQQKVCFHWREGKCTRFPCPFLHSELPTSENGAPSKRVHESLGSQNDRHTGGFKRSQNKYINSSSWGRVPSQAANSKRTVVKKIDKLCHHWLQGSCKFGDNCKYLHKWSTGDYISFLTLLEGHQQVVTGIALPSGSDKLYTGSQDETVRLWDCQSGQMAGAITLGGAVGCMLSEGQWVFVGLKNLVKAWNIQTNTELSLNGPVGQVYYLVTGNDFLFAGTEEGTILAWKYNIAANCFEPAASLKGHTLAVVTLVVGGNRLYSGSMDHSIKMWNLENFQCLQTLTGHSDVVMSVLCWDQFLLSASLDKTVQVWVSSENGSLEVAYTHTEEHGVLTLCGMHDSEAKPVLLCSSNDNSLRVYDLPSFSERGRIFSNKEIRCIQIGPNGLFFTGDGSGQVRVWKLAHEPSSVS